MPDDVKAATTDTTASATATADAAKTAATAGATTDAGTKDTAAAATGTTDKATTLVGGDGKTTVEDKVATAPADWPDDWRDRLAGEDKDFRKQLDRYGSPLDLAQKLRNQDKLISSGQLKRPLADNATPEQVAQWRRDNGIPEKPGDYKIELKNGMVPGEADKPIIEAFAKQAHEKNWTPTQLNDALQFYYETQDAQQQESVKLDATQRQATDDLLHAEWGKDYRPYINAIDNLLGAAPDGLGKLLVGGRLADGTLIGNDARVMKFLRSIVSEINPAATLIPPNMDASKGVESRIEEIRRINREDPNKYESDKAMQKEYLDLLEAQSKLRHRAA